MGFSSSFLKRICQSVLIFCVITFPFQAFSQETFQLTSEAGPIDPSYLVLLASNDSLSDNDLLNEAVLDLVDVYVVDSILTKKTQRHRFPGSPLIQLLGLKWKAISMHKKKFVGTSRRELYIPEKPRLKEYDINFDLIPHREPYISLGFEGYATQKEIGRAKKRYNGYTSLPFIRPENERALDPYFLHCECTPHPEFVPALNQLFFPTIKGNSLEKHPNFESQHTSIGLYGAFVSDCNHKCHPEIHPYEWIWWLNLNEDWERKEHTRSWMAGLIRDASERMRDWVQAPRTGEISIPFLFPAGDTLDIYVQHLAFNSFLADSLASQIDLPDAARSLGFISPQWFRLENASRENTCIRLSSSYPIRSKGLKFWFSELRSDAEKGMISGRFHLAVSVEDLYTARIQFRYE
jgi:hypothetical protein